MNAKKEKTAGQKRLETIILVIVALVVIFRFTQAYIDLKNKQHMEMGGQPVPDFTWFDIEGNKRSLAAIKDKVIVLHFWATWCAPCRVEFPSMLRAAKHLGDDVVFLTISGDDTEEPVRKFLIGAKQRAGVSPDNMLYGWDPMRKIVFDMFQTSAFPETIIIDEQLKMRRKITGRTDWENPEMLNYIKNLKNPPKEEEKGGDASGTTPVGGQEQGKADAEAKKPDVRQTETKAGEVKKP